MIQPLTQQSVLEPFPPARMVALPQPVVPPPWQLRGDGLIVLYRLPAATRSLSLAGSPTLRGRDRGGIGNMMWVRYREAPIGPYDELIYSPGLVSINGRWAFSIARIYVSTWESVVNGRANWGIPKDRADFAFDTLPGGEQRATALLNGSPVAEVLYRTSARAIPLDTRALPLPLAQVWRETVFRFHFSARGRAHWADILRVRTDADAFAPLEGIAPLGALLLRDFDMTFPVPMRYFYASGRR
jgi:hypothetical protein